MTTMLEKNVAKALEELKADPLNAGREYEVTYRGVSGGFDCMNAGADGRKFAPVITHRERNNLAMFIRHHDDCVEQYDYDLDGYSCYYVPGLYVVTGALYGGSCNARAKQRTFAVIEEVRTCTR
jgi:hypothetical protein